jgi:hypothetical protein
MDQTYRMLGREHEADLEREAAKWRLADQAPDRQRRSGLTRRIDEERKARKLLRGLREPFRVHRAHADT